jgi:hypothetical protein
VKSPVIVEISGLHLEPSITSLPLVSRVYFTKNATDLQELGLAFGSHRGYSYRSATIGSIFAARYAGT